MYPRAWERTDEAAGASWAMLLAWKIALSRSLSLPEFPFLHYWVAGFRIFLPLSNRFVSWLYCLSLLLVSLWFLLCISSCGKSLLLVFKSFFKKDFFLMCTIFKVFIKFVTILLLFNVLGFRPQGTWDLSVPARDQTHTSGIGRWSLNHWATREITRSFLSIVALWITVILVCPWEEGRSETSFSTKLFIPASLSLELVPVTPPFYQWENLRA